MFLHLFIAECLFLLLGPLEIGTAPNGGDCSYLRNQTLNRVCSGLVPHVIAQVYLDALAPSLTAFDMWESNATGDQPAIILVSFYRSGLTNYSTIEIRLGGVDTESDDFLGTDFDSNGPVSFTLKPSYLLCYNTKMQYPIELKYVCLLNTRSPEGEMSNRTVLHYAISPPIRELASRFSGFGALLLVMPIMVVFEVNKCMQM